jgi:hypothetical protein
MSQLKILARNKMHDDKAIAKDIYEQTKREIENDFNKETRPVNDKFSETKKKLETEYHSKLDPLKEQHEKDLEPFRIERQQKIELAQQVWKERNEQINGEYLSNRTNGIKETVAE